MDSFQETQSDYGLNKTPEDQAHSSPLAPEGLGPWLVRNGPYIVPVVGLLLWFCIAQNFDLEKIFALAKVVLGLGLVIFIHELGHFLVAKWCDVHVETFSIGFGPPIPGCVFRRGETTYMIALLPLGGYVKMVGEGPEEDTEDDPRSFKNKPVWQRMAIISAGVTMNILLAFALFVYVFLSHGAPRSPGVVGRVEPGSPAWVAGIKPGDVIYWYGSKGPRPYFNDILPVTINSKKDEAIRLVVGPPELPEDKWHWDSIVARRDKDDTRPIIGISPPSQIKLWPKKMQKAHELPVYYHSAAAEANPPFHFDDTIVGTTDPRHPEDVDHIEPLPLDPRTRPGDPPQFDYFEFRRRMHLLAEKPVTIQVRRADSGETVNVQVKPAFTWTLGLRMAMGKITSMRKGSEAATQLNPDEFDYYIQSLKLSDSSGQSIRYPEDINDPLRLPNALERWALVHPGPKIADLVLMRSVVNPPTSPPAPGNHPVQVKMTFKLRWNEQAESGHEDSIMLTDPVVIGGLGIAYRVNSTVEEVLRGSPAARGGIQKNDKIIAFRFFESGKKVSDESTPQRKWTDLKEDQWAPVFDQLQNVDIPKLELRIELADGGTREVIVDAQPDLNWPRDDRGLLLIPARELQKADSVGQALVMGVNETWSFTSQIFGNLVAIATGRVSVGGVMGPLGIAQTAFSIAGEDFDSFLIFLGIIGVNLAVINFMPIPVLDGGHMAFLIYEWIRGKPAPEGVRIAATYVGLAAILSLMVLVIYLDVKRNWG